MPDLMPYLGALGKSLLCAWLLLFLAACLGMSSAYIWPCLIRAHRGPSSKGSVRCAGEPEGGLDCAAVPGGNGSRICGDGQCLAPVCWAGEQDLPSGLAREIGAGSAWQEAG